MAEKGRRAGGVHFLRFSAEQRPHLAALLTLLLFAAPLCAQSDIDFSPDITEEEFRKFSRLVAQGIFASPVHPAGAAGILRFDIGLAATVVEIDTSASYWQRAVGDDFSVGDDYLGLPRLVFVKGLGGATIAGTYAKISDTGITVWGGSVDLPIINGGLLRPTVALRGSYSTLRGVDVYRLKTYGLEGFIGKGIGPLTVYGGYGRMRSDARGTIPETASTPEIILEDESNIDRITVGARFSLGLPRLVFEATQAEEIMYSAKLSLGL
ncbi:MAG TPA: hypothetical protein VMS98_01090 [Thermoanaerobaculia bacterium]|nr:hypothetical protein [Thermoanaerobaculia bacterium]